MKIAADWSYQKATEFQQALEAIKARINGEWDNPALVHYGELSTNESEDILHIIEEEGL